MKTGSKQVGIITGGSRGIGRGIALQLAKHGWSLFIIFKSNRVAAEETIRMINNLGGDGIPIRADISDSNHRLEIAKSAEHYYGRIDLLVNNAGIAPEERNDILDLKLESYEKVIETNLTGPLFLTQIISKLMIEHQQTGAAKNQKIINISSISAYTSSPERSEYCISKAGLSMVTKLFADRLAEYGIGVFEIRPGIITTDMTAVVQEKYNQLIESGITPIRRWGTPEDVGKAVLAIAEGYFPFSTGEILNVDGGFHFTRL